MIHVFKIVYYFKPAYAVDPENIGAVDVCVGSFNGADDGAFGDEFSGEKSATVNSTFLNVNNGDSSVMMRLLGWLSDSISAAKLLRNFDRR